MLRFVSKVVIVLLLLGGGVFLFSDVEVRASFLEITGSDSENTSSVSDGAPNDMWSITFDSGNYIVKHTFAPINLSQRCVVSSVAYNEYDGILVGCSDGTLQILEIQSNDNSLFTPSEFNLGGAILGLAWYENNSIVLTADGSDAGQVRIYRFSKQNTDWQMSKKYEGYVAVNEASVLYSIDGVGVIGNAKDGVYLIDEKRAYVLLPHEYVIYADGTKDFYVIQSQGDVQSNLYFYMGDTRILSLKSFFSESYPLHILGVTQNEHERKVNFLYNGSAYTIALK